jgi:hypothetical protein
MIDGVTSAARPRRAVGGDPTYYQLQIGGLLSLFRWEVCLGIWNCCQTDFGREGLTFKRKTPQKMIPQALAQLLLLISYCKRLIKCFKSPLLICLQSNVDESSSLVRILMTAAEWLKLDGQ